MTDYQKASLPDEIRLLEKADRDIEAGEARVREQTALIEELERDGHDTSLALKLLTTLKDSLQAMVAHRTLILERIQYLNRERD